MRRRNPAKARTCVGLRNVPSVALQPCTQVVPSFGAGTSLHDLTDTFISEARAAEVQEPTQVQKTPFKSGGDHDHAKHFMKLQRAAMSDAMDLEHYFHFFSKWHTDGTKGIKDVYRLPILPSGSFHQLYVFIQKIDSQPSFQLLPIMKCGNPSKRSFCNGTITNKLATAI